MVNSNTLAFSRVDDGAVWTHRVGVGCGGFDFEGEGGGRFVLQGHEPCGTGCEGGWVSKGKQSR